MDRSLRPLPGGRRRRWVGWFDVLGRRTGAWAFALNRLTGLGLALYLFIHLAVLTLLAMGPTKWNSFIRLAKSPFFLALDLLLLFGMIFHGLNGVRVALVGMGVAVRIQKLLFWIFMAAGLLFFGVGGWLILAS